jgi:cysteine-rich repeat protein
MIAGCVGPDIVVCGDGRICPADTECRQLPAVSENVCATDEQVGACNGKAQFDPCTLRNVAASHCVDGVCLETRCGNFRVDVGEQCDDGNAITGDGCSADCLSDETCGNNVRDLVGGEACDDGNLLDHDGCSSTCKPETLRWVQRVVIPPKRSDGVAAYDPLRDRIVMFSGSADLLGIVGDLWEWDGAVWTQFTGPVPPGRADAAMAFDGNGVVLYGGGIGLSDTWTFNGVSWVSHADAAPGPRFGHAMAYDARRKRAVMFGGGVTAGTTALADGTWEWDGTQWMKQMPANSPPPRRAHVMAYDPVRGKVVLAGGSNNSSYLSDTWTYDGTDWTQVGGTSWPALDQAAAAFDPASGAVIAFGGSNTGAYSDKTLAWNGSTWTDLGLAGPTERHSGQMASTDDHVVYFGGVATGASDPVAETWIFRTQGGASSWSQPPTPGLLVPQDVAYANDIARGRLVVYDGGSGATWELSSTGWEKRATTGPSPRSSATLAYDPIARNIVLFGGRYNGTSTLDDTWVWDGTTWMQKTPASHPSARFAVSIVFDGQHLTLVGGNAGPNGSPPGPTHDAWFWDGSTWTQVAEPPAEVDGLEGYDPIRNVAVTFTGTKTFTYDGTTWVDVTSGEQPTHESPLAWNPARGTLVLAGGIVSNDLWEWDGAAWTQLQAERSLPTRQSPIVATALDGAGILLRGGIAAAPMIDEWELRFDGSSTTERCTGADSDGDMLVGCADPDCWSVCTPECPPRTSCAATAPRCGDGACDPVHETCLTCAADCTCGQTCGDFVCAGGETCPGDCP